jgi:hypothetical protein
VAALAGLGGAASGNSFDLAARVFDAEAGDGAADDHQDARYADAEVEG